MRCEFAALFCFLWSLLYTGVLGSDLLMSALEKAAGVYKDGTRVTDDLRQTVLVTACNNGFINHLQNFKCFADRLGMKFLVIAMDKEAYNYISNNTTMDTYLMDIGSGLSAEFRKGAFNKITVLKKKAVHEILTLGYNVLFSDTDVAMVQDPLPYMLFKNVDYVHSLNYWCTTDQSWDFHKSKVEGNTGFYFVRSNANTIKLWYAGYKAAPSYPKLDDQAVFWKIIRKMKDPTVLPLAKCRHFDTPADQATSRDPITNQQYLVSCHLDTCMFSSGMISRYYEPEMTYETLQANLRAMNNSMIAMHANYISGNERKMEIMRNSSFWLADTATGHGNKCAPYVPMIL